MMSNAQDHDKEELLEGPFKIALSPQGAESFATRGQKIKKYQFLDGTEQFGIEMPSISSKALQKMAMSGSIHKIERSIQSFAKQRRGVMDLTRYFGFSVLFKQFEIKLWEIVLKSEVTTQWNRQYPRLNLNANTNTKNQAFTMLLEKAKESILQFKQQALASVQTRIQADPKALPDEKKARLLQAIRFLNAIDPVVWLLLATSKDPVATNVLLQDIQRLLVSYNERSELPEYLALMLVELVVIVGNVSTMGLSSPISGMESHDSVFISYEMNTLKKSQEEKTRVRIVLGNQASGFEELKTRIDSSASGQKSLDSYFGDSRNQDLGLMYLQYVQDACRKMNIFFDSFANTAPNSRRTLVNINLTI